jgi:hypothetical protein
VRWCMDMRVGRGGGSTDDADVCGLRTVCHTRPEVESMCVHTWVWLLDRHVYTYARAAGNLNSDTDPEIYLPMRAASSSEPSHTCGRGCLPGTLPLTLPYANNAHLLDKASLLEASRVYMWWVIC